MITLKCIKPIKDSSVNRKRLVNEIFEVTPERAIQIETALGANEFRKYFVIQKVAKVETKNEKPKTVKKKKGE
jgi:hypothetical protein